MMRQRRSVVALLLTAAVVASAAQDASEAPRLVRQLGQFPAAMDARIQSNTGQRMPAEERREAIYIKLRALAGSAAPALQRGLADADVQVRRNVALYLGFEGGNYAKHAATPLDVKPFLPQLVMALRDRDERVKALAAQALEHVGADAVVAIPDLVRLLEDPSEGLRNSACIGLAGIGPAARDALPALRRALADSSNDVRRFAQRAIDKIAQKVDPERPLPQTPQLTATSPEVERRDLPVTNDDLGILLKARELLKSDSVWNRNDDRECVDDEATGKRSLFCALEKACIDVLGAYDHRRAALQEVRFAVEEATEGQDFEHRLRDFNNLPKTRLAEIQKVLQTATDRVKARLKRK